jgi:hypothetical protein
VNTKSCPNCGIEVPGTAENCTCGFTFVDYEGGFQAPGAVRSGEGAMAVQAVPMREPEAPPVAQPAVKPPAKPVTKAVPVPTDATPRPNPALLMDCPSCDKRISKRAPRCPHCGSSPYEYCEVCAERILANSASCPACGDPQPFG